MLCDVAGQRPARAVRGMSTPNEDLTQQDVVAQSVAAYTEHVEAYEAFNAEAVPTQALLFLAGLVPQSHILDAGCGPGRDLARFTAAGHRPVGVDLNPEFVAKASEHGDATVGDLRNLRFDDNTFHATWACASLVHLPPQDVAAALAEIARVTMPGGRVYVSVKHVGQTGWVDTAHGRRFFQIWQPADFAAAVHDAGMTVHETVVGDVFVDVWATA